MNLKEVNRTLPRRYISDFNRRQNEELVRQFSNRQRYANDAADRWLYVSALLEHVLTLNHDFITDAYLDIVNTWSCRAMREVLEELNYFKGKEIDTIAEELLTDFDLSPEQRQVAKEKGMSVFKNGEWPRTIDDALDNLPIIEYSIIELLSRDQSLKNELTELFGKISEFVTSAFNSSEYLINFGEGKISVDTSPLLVKIIILNSYCQYSGKTLDDIDSERGIIPIESLPRRQKDKIIDVYKTLQLKLHNDETYRNAADAWYRCRVNPGTVTDAAKKISQIQNRSFKTVRKALHKQIKLIDIALDYPQKHQ